MRNYEAFTLGVITSGLVAWFWGKEITDYLREQTRGVRTQAVEGLQAVADGTGKVLDRGGDALRRAEEVLQDTKEQVGDALRSGQDAIRPTPSPRKV
jgi:hypothetical protein